MKHAFTIIEVIISVVILALVGVALLQNGAKSLDIFEHLRKKEDISDYLTIIANHPNPDYNHLTKALEDFLPQFAVDDDELRKLLKQKFRYQESYIKAELPTLEGFDQEEEEQEQESPNLINVNFIKLSITSKKGGDYIYRLELNE